MRTFAFFMIAATIGLTIGAIAICHFVAGYPLIGIDDANIFLTYAQNLVRGCGFVYAAPGRRVEGFTSLAWVLVCALATRFSNDPELVLLAINVGLVVLVVTSLALFVRALLTLSGGAAARHAGLCATLVLPWCFLGPDYVVWMTLPLMDTALWGTVFTLGTLATALTLDTGSARRDRTIWLAIIGSVALVTRPESILLVPLWIVIGVVGSYALSGDILRAVRRYVGPVAICTLTFAALVGFRLAYFGYPLPNAYYAKVSPSLLYNVREGTNYLLRFAFCHTLVVPFLACAVVAAFPLMKRLLDPSRDGAPSASEVAEVRLAVVALIVITGVTPPILSGGDHFAQFRFYQPVWPFLIVPPLGLFGGTTIRIGSARAPETKVFRWASRAILALGLAFGLYASHRPTWGSLIRHLEGTIVDEFVLAQDGRLTGALLNRTLGEPPAFSIGVVAAGGIAVSFHGETIDLLGLNNTEMAHYPGDRRGLKNHAAFNPDVFYKQAPDLVLPFEYNQDQGLPTQLVPGSVYDRLFLKGLMSSQLFRSRYVLASLARSDRPEVLIASWVRRDRMDELAKCGMTVEDLSRSLSP